MQRNSFAMLLFFMGISMWLIPAQSETKGHMRKDALLARPVAGMESVNFSTVSALEAALSSAGVPGGITVITGCMITPEKTIHVSGTTLGAVLRSLVHADPRYRWSIEDGVVDLLPRQGVPPILSVKIRTLDVKDAANLSDAANVLFGLPEFREAATRFGLVQGGVQSFLSSGGGQAEEAEREHRTFQLHLKNTTVLSALNTIVRANKGGVWIYNERYCNGRGVFNISFSQ